jgi:aerobic-type carbon monoxide dehydrogenase small subunit (CoxS/CutS family)
MDTGTPTPIRLRCRVNGRPVDLEIQQHELLLDVVRGRLGLTGAKRSCDAQVCGSCTVLLDGQPVSACCTLAYEARGREVLTIEGLAADGPLHPLQQAFVDHAAVQCGFCTPGMVLTALALLREVPQPDAGQVKTLMAGALCRCTGYWKIIEAVVDAGRRLAAEEVRS